MTKVILYSRRLYLTWRKPESVLGQGFLSHGWLPLSQFIWLWMLCGTRQSKTKHFSVRWALPTLLMVSQNDEVIFGQALSNESKSTAPIPFVNPLKNFIFNTLPPFPKFHQIFVNVSQFKCVSVWR